MNHQNNLVNKIKMIDRIDHSKIPEGYATYQGKMYDLDDNCVGPIPRKLYESEEQYKKEFDEYIKKQELDNPEDKTISTGRKTQADHIIDLIESMGDEVTLFHDDTNDPCIRLKVQDHYEIWKCKSGQFKRWISQLYWSRLNKVPNLDAIRTALNIIEAKACFEGPEYELANRLLSKDGSIWYDMSDSKWRVVEINKQGWKIVENPPILFKRYSHQKPQVDPIKDGNVKDILKFVNIVSDDQQLLLLVWLVTSFIPDFPHPILNVYGSQGSAKSVLCKLLKCTVDPSLITTASFQKDVREFVQLLSHHWCIFFDNLSYLSNDSSDCLCKAVSGEGFSKRKLHSDDDDIIYNFKRCIGINGINLVGRNPDLLERSILLELGRIETDKRKLEVEIMEEFERSLPSILGGIFDVVSKAIQIKGDIKIDLFSVTNINKHKSFLFLFIFFWKGDAGE